MSEYDGDSGRTHDEEEHGQRAEARELDWPAAPAVDEEKREVVAWNQTRHGEDDVSDGNVVQVMVDTLRREGGVL